MSTNPAQLPCPPPPTPRMVVPESKPSARKTTCSASGVSLLDQFQCPGDDGDDKFALSPKKIALNDAAAGERPPATTVRSAKTRLFPKDSTRWATLSTTCVIPTRPPKERSRQSTPGDTSESGSDVDLAVDKEQILSRLREKHRKSSVVVAQKERCNKNSMPNGLGRRKLVLDDEDEDDEEDDEAGFPARNTKRSRKRRLEISDEENDTIDVLETGPPPEEPRRGMGTGRRRLRTSRELALGMAECIITQESAQRRILRNPEADDDIVAMDERDPEPDPVDSGPTFEETTLNFFNTASEFQIREFTGCSGEDSHRILNGRPYDKIDGAKSKTSIPRKLVSAFWRTRNELDAIDHVLLQVQKASEPLNKLLKLWESQEILEPEKKYPVYATDGKTTEMMSIPALKEALKVRGQGNDKDPVLLKSFQKLARSIPKMLREEVFLKQYQCVGASWMLALKRLGISGGILADEMGLGKTAQTVVFLASLYMSGVKGPNLVVCPKSTAENWVREFSKWLKPAMVESMNIILYSGSVDERVDLQETIAYTKPYVIVAGYDSVVKNPADLHFMRAMRFLHIILDEGHMIKNSKSQRNRNLCKVACTAKLRILLTGTPVQNDVLQLMTLLDFVIPDMFHIKQWETLFEMSKQIYANESSERLDKAKRLVGPFVLRRTKDCLLHKQLTRKTHRNEYCVMDRAQNLAYRRTHPPRLNLASLMEMRKAAIHPALMRTAISDEEAEHIINGIGATEEEKDEMAIRMHSMNHFELFLLFRDDRFDESPVPSLFRNQTIGHISQPLPPLFRAAKLERLQELLPIYKERGDRALVFSQFAKVLDILEFVFDCWGVNFRRLDGSTEGSDRQQLVDEFNEDDSILAFLITTRAGGLGLNLTGANVVIIFDLDYNVFSDMQAEDRAYRLGQTRDVSVVRLIVKDTIEETILAVRQAKLALARQVIGDSGGGSVEQEVLKALLRNEVPTLGHANGVRNDNTSQDPDESGPTACPATLEAVSQPATTTSRQVHCASSKASGELSQGCVQPRPITLFPKASRSSREPRNRKLHEFCGPTVAHGPFFEASSTDCSEVIILEETGAPSASSTSGTSSTIDPGLKRSNDGSKTVDLT